MIDIENALFNKIALYLRANVPGVSVYGEYVDLPSAFPCVTITEADNYVNTNYSDTDGIEHRSNVMYEVNVYSNLVNGKKEQATAIAEMVDSQMALYGFTRTMKFPTPNTDRTIYRITMRYTASVSKRITNDTIEYFVFRR